MTCTLMTPDLFFFFLINTYKSKTKKALGTPKKANFNLS